MNTDFLLEKHWPCFGQGNHSVASKMLHEWCVKISAFVSSLSERLTLLESKDKINLDEICKLKTDLAVAQTEKKSPSIVNDWVQVVKAGTQKTKQPAAQLVVVNASVNELKDRERRKKNIIVYGIPESPNSAQATKKTEDEESVKQILNVIGKS